ncbi:MAG: PilZ domain-containing protein [Planctomycetota bacterium]
MKGQNFLPKPQLDASTMKTNQRQFHRIQSTGQACTFSLRGEQYEVRLIDQSFDGVRVGDLKIDRLMKDEPVEIDLGHKTLTGLTRSVSSNTDDTYQVGVKLVDKKAEPFSDFNGQQLLGQFIRFQNKWVFCKIQKYVGANRAQIQLLGGKEIVIARSQIFQWTMEERKQMLADKFELATTRKFYHSLNPNLALENIESIVQLEFQIHATAHPISHPCGTVRGLSISSHEVAT